MLLSSAISYIIVCLHVCPLSKQFFDHLQVTIITCPMKCCISTLKYNNTSQYTHKIDSQYSSHSYYSLLAYIITKMENDVLECSMEDRNMTWKWKTHTHTHPPLAHIQSLGYHTGTTHYSNALIKCYILHYFLSQYLPLE